MQNEAEQARELYLKEKREQVAGADTLIQNIKICSTAPDVPVMVEQLACLMYELGKDDGYFGEGWQSSVDTLSGQLWFKNLQYRPFTGERRG